MNQRFEAVIELPNILLYAEEVEIAIKEGLRMFAMRKAQMNRPIFIPANFLSQFESVAVRLNPVGPTVRTVIVKKKYWAPDDEYLVVEAQVTGAFKEGQEVTVSITPK